MEHGEGFQGAPGNGNGRQAHQRRRPDHVAEDEQAGQGQARAHRGSNVTARSPGFGPHVVGSPDVTRRRGLGVRLGRPSGSRSSTGTAEACLPTAGRPGGSTVGHLSLSS